MIGDRAYNAFTLGMVVFGLIAVAFSSVGLYMMFVGSADSGPEQVELGEFACEEFDGDPEIAHDADYRVTRTLRGTSQIDSINATDTGGGVRLAITVSGEFLNGSASSPGGTNVPVRTPSDGPDIVIETTETPFRLWIDNIDDSTVTRTQLDICRPT